MATSTSGTISGGSVSGDLGITIPEYESHMHISRWLERLELYAIINGLDESMKLGLVKFLLPDHIAHTIELKNVTTFSDAKSALIEFNVRKSPPEEAFDNLKSARKGVSSWSDFGQKVIAWANIAYTPSSADREAKDVLYRQLSPEEQKTVGMMVDSWSSKR